MEAQLEQKGKEIELEKQLEERGTQLVEIMRGSRAVLEEYRSELVKVRGELKEFEVRNTLNSGSIEPPPTDNSSPVQRHHPS